MRPISFFLSFLLSCFLFSACTGNGENIQQVLLTKDNVNSYIEEQKVILGSDEENVSAHYNLARSFYFVKDYESAEKHARRATRFDPFNASYYELLGSIAFALERYGDAITELAIAVRISPERVSAYLKLAATYEKINDDGRAISSLEQALQVDRLYVEALYHLARIYLRQREFEGSIRTLETLLNLEPQNKEALLMRVQTYSLQGSYYYAQTLAEEMLNQFPDFAPIRRELLRIQFAQQQWPEAQALLIQLRSKSSFSTEDQLIEAYLLLHQEQEKEARLLFETILEQQPKNVDAIMGLAVQLLRKGFLDDSLTWLTRGLEINPLLARAHYLRSSILFRQGDYLQGDLAIGRALELDSANPSYQLLFLRRQLMKGELSVVEKQLKRIQEKHPLNTEALQLQADLYKSRGNSVEAEKLLRQAILVHDSPSVHFSLARVLYQQRKYRSVLEVTTPLLEVLSGNWEVVYLHALTLSRVGKYEDALEISQPYLEHKESQGYAHRLVGDLLRYAGKEQEAQKILQKGLVQFPGHLFLVDGLSASLVMTEDWEQVRELLETTLEQSQRLSGNPPMQLLFLDRLAVAYQRLNKIEEKIQILRKFHQKNDPLTAAQLHSLEEQLLFPISLPSLDKTLSPLLLP
ncbi:MAG TPA: tetratricopeptide repeat protein [Candidatus Lambdaproteobacteria bacterium]|nr:tetratricopeptide repeat protein [Candidatus Lambdaproteobacteria bacterium]